MADLHRIQNCLGKLSSLIQEVEAILKLADTEPLKNKLFIWKSETDAVLEHEIEGYTREVEDFNRRWRMPMIGNTHKTAIIRKLRNAYTDLRLIIRAEQPQPEPRHSRLDRVSLPEYAITDYAKQLYGV